MLHFFTPRRDGDGRFATLLPVADGLQTYSQGWTRQALVYYSRLLQPVRAGSFTLGFRPQ